VSLYGFRPYVPVAVRQQQAKKKLAALRKQGRSVEPVEIEGRTIAKSFWGSSWCENLERYSDYASRLPRGRSYVRNGSVIDLKIAKGEVAAWVSGSELYEVKVTIAPVKAAHWTSICRDCAGTIDSLVELLQGRLAKGVMDRVCRKGDGLFPAPDEIKLDCSCPDWADMCKHVAAVLYGVGARLDQNPKLLFVLRGVDETDLLARAGQKLPLTKAPATGTKVLDDSDLAAVFGLDMADGIGSADAPPAARTQSQRRKAAGDDETRSGADSKAAAAEKSKTPRSRTGNTSPRAADKVSAGKLAVAKVAVGSVRKATAKTTSAPVVRLSRLPRTPPAATIVTPAIGTKTTAAKTRGPDHGGRSKPEPKRVALSRARKRRAGRGSPHDA
jgi:uncharacterized Zn finger protein